MAQGFTGYNNQDIAITVQDSSNLDAFSRFRVSNPLTIFSNQFTYDKTPYVFDKLTNNAAFTDAKFDTQQRIMKMQLKPGAAPNDYIYYQSYEYIPYQPGRSQLVFITFNFFPPFSPGFGTSTKMVGLSDGNNGFELVYDYFTNTFNFKIVTTTSAGNQTVDQNNWNLDKLDGTGASGININFGCTQILVIDFQALYVGRVRFGFDINGTIIYAHEFLNADVQNYPYIATANLPIRAGIVSSGAAVNDEMYFICCSVASEGGSDDAQRFGYTFVYTGNYLTVPSAAMTYMFSLSPALVFNGYTNRVKVVLDSIEIINTGNKAVKYQLGIGANITTPTWNNINTLNSSIQYDTTGTSAGGQAITFDAGYVPAGLGAKSTLATQALHSKYPITLDPAGAKRNNGNVSLYAQGLGGTTDIYWSIIWKEIR